ncbi:MAG TPA: PfkB family carbohydrate kinase [Myxococcota bacterium]|nr:PfkB family carbohydrate kinase [Myxococcota bacterium]
MTHPTVVGLGLCVVDHLYVVAELPGASERTRYTQRAVRAGGMVANALAQAAQLGCRAELISLVGDDSDGRYARRSLRALGVSTRGLVLSHAVPTTIAVVMIAARGGERRFLTAHRAPFERRAPALDLTPIRPGRVLLIDGHFPAQAMRAARRARAVGVPVVADFSDPRPDYLRLLPYVDHAVLPEAFVRQWAPGDPADALRRLYREFGGAPVVTLGARGGIYWHGGRVRRFRSPRVHVHDTTGAGDVFHGAFAAGLAHGLELPEIVERAARAGALACTAIGATARLASRSEWSRGIGRVRPAR